MLDTAKTFSQRDPSGIGYGVEHLAEQVRLAWHDTHGMRVPASYRSVSHILIVGMGGAGLGPELLTHALQKRLSVPVLMTRGYDLPSFAGKDTLLVLSSFSGTTEEVLAVAQEARRKKIKTVVMTTGGALADTAVEAGWPLYRYTPGELASAPRFGLAFSFAGLMGILQAAKMVKIQDGDVRRVRTAMGDVLDTCAIDVPTDENPAKAVAYALQGKPVVVCGAEHLVGNAHTLCNQLNESAKHAAFFVSLPEANHHFLEGLQFPKGFAKGATVVMLRSSLYHPRVTRRFDVTADMLERMGLQVIDYVAGGKDALEECGEVLQFSSFVAYYLGLLEGVDPTAMTVTDEFKKKLGA